MQGGFRVVVVMSTKKRRSAALYFLNCYVKDGDEFLTHIVTRDKILENKRRSTLVHRPNQKKSKRQSQLKKLWLQSSGTNKGLFLMDFIDHRATINTVMYCKILKKTVVGYSKSQKSIFLFKI